MAGDQPRRGQRHRGSDTPRPGGSECHLRGLEVDGRGLRRGGRDPEGLALAVTLAGAAEIRLAPASVDRGDGRAADGAGLATLTVDTAVIAPLLVGQVFFHLVGEDGDG